MSTSRDSTPLPDGWIREYDPKTQHPFWVDTNAKPPRSIWVHPYEDEQFLREHPDVRDLAGGGSSEAPPPYTPRRHSFAGTPSGSHLTVPERADAIRSSHSQPGTPAGSRQKPRGFFGKLKDKAIGTKEERAARHRAEQEWARQQAEVRRKRQQEQLAAYGPRYRQSQYSTPFGQSYGQPYGQPVYAAPAGDPFAFGGRSGRTGFGGGGFGGGGFGGGGIGVPLLAGAAGGLLLGDIFDGGFGGGFGGFDGGFGGGGFF